jgi:hypothetical protein
VKFQKNAFHWRLRILPIDIPVTVVRVLHAQQQDPPDSEEVSAWLAAIEARAIILSVDASTLESYTRRGGSWESHSAVVERMREHLSELGREFAKLPEVQAQASPWQRAAINRIRPLLRELSENTEKAIEYIDDDPGRLLLDEYRDYIEANADLSVELPAIISDFLKYGDTSRRLKSLASTLDLNLNHKRQPWPEERVAASSGSVGAGIEDD